jgi:hypothetical protein
MHLLVGFFFSYPSAAELRTSVRAFDAIPHNYRFQATKRNFLVTRVFQTRNRQCRTDILYMNVLIHTVSADDIFIALGKSLYLLHLMYNVKLSPCEP